MKDSKYFSSFENPMQSQDDVRNAWLSVFQKTNDSDRYDAALAALTSLQQSELAYQRSLPEEQIQHLMATGMSRAAAMQLLSGGEMSPAQVSPAGNVEQNRIDKVNTALNALNQITAVVQSGFAIGANVQSIRHAVEATRALQIQNNMSELYASAQMAVGRYLQAFDNYKTAKGVEFNPSLNEMVDEVTKSEFGASMSKWTEDMANPYFYPVMRSAYAEQAMDKTQLANMIRRENAYAKAAEIDVDSATYSAKMLWNELKVSNETVDDKVDLSHIGLRMATSQAEMYEMGAEMQRIDNSFWLQFDGKNRINYLFNQTQAQAYQTALLELDIDYKEDFNETAAAELANRLKAAQALGDDYFQIEAQNLMQVEEYRKCALQLEKMRMDSAMQFRQKVDEGDLGEGRNVPFSDNWWRSKTRPLADYLHATGCTDMAIKYSAQAVGLLAK